MKIKLDFVSKAGIIDLEQNFSGGKTMKNKLKVLAIVLSLMMLVACGGAGGGGTEFISIATGGISGTYYPLGGALATVLNSADINVEANAQSTGASVENINLINSDEAEIAFVQNDVAFYAKEGTYHFEESGAIDSIRGLTAVYPEIIQIVARKDSGINSVEDLAGKRVGVGSAGSGTEINASQILDAYGMDYDDFAKTDYLSFAESAEGIQNGQLDAAFITASSPTAAITELSTTMDIAIVPLDADKIDKLTSDYSFYRPIDIDTSEYLNMDADSVPSVAVECILVVNESMDDDLAYDITKALFEDLDTMKGAHARGNDITLDSAMEGMSIELHPGAARYLEENGIN